MRLCQAVGAVLLGCLFLVFLALTSPAQEIKIDHMQKANILMASGRQYQGIVIFVNAKEVRFQIYGQKAITYPAANVKAVETAEGVIVYNTARSAWEKMDASAGTPPDKEKGVAATPRPEPERSAPTPPPEEKAKKPTSVAEGPAEAGAARTMTVIAEGAGKTPDDALKDAFRSAVGQVIGEVVDRETRVENDEVIADKVLTASNGFVAGYDRLKLTEEGGLVRIKIKARVEQAELIDRLRGFGIRVTRIKTTDVLPAEKDRRFSDARVQEMTREEAVRNKTELLHDYLADLPKVLEARCPVPNRFAYDAKTSTLKLQVQVRGDEALYARFLKGLALRLDKLSLARGFATTSGEPRDLVGYGPLAGVPGFSVGDAKALLAPDLREQPNAWCLWVRSGVYKGGASLNWTGYVLDADLHDCLRELQGELKVLVALRDADGKVLQEKVLDLKDQGWLGEVMSRSRKGHMMDLGSGVLDPLPENVKVASVEKTANVVLAPMQLSIWGDNGRGWDPIAWYVLVRPYPITVTVSPEELQALRDIRCTVVLRSRP